MEGKQNNYYRKEKKYSYFYNIRVQSFPWPINERKKIRKNIDIKYIYIQIEMLLISRQMNKT